MSNERHLAGEEEWRTAMATPGEQTSRKRELTELVVGMKQALAGSFDVAVRQCHSAHDLMCQLMQATDGMLFELRGEQHDRLIEVRSQISKWLHDYQEPQP